MNNKHNIPAFTLSEMSVVLVITSIVVGIAFSVLSLVQSHMHSIQTNFNSMTEFNKLKQSLWIDFQKHSKVRYNNLDEALIFVSEQDSISYTFLLKGIVKNKDTFNITVANKQLYFDGDMVSNGIIDAIKIECSKTLQSKTLFVFKYNDAQSFMN